MVDDDKNPYRPPIDLRPDTQDHGGIETDYGFLGFVLSVAAIFTHVVGPPLAGRVASLSWIILAAAVTLPLGGVVLSFIGLWTGPGKWSRIGLLLGILTSLAIPTWLLGVIARR